MANYEAKTASSRANIKEGEEKNLRAYLDKWYLNDLEYAIGEGKFEIYGECDFSPTLKNENGEQDEEGDPDPEGFILGLKPFLEEKKEGYVIAIQSVGYEKCIYPLGAFEYILRTGEVEFNGFKNP